MMASSFSEHQNPAVFFDCAVAIPTNEREKSLQLILFFFIAIYIHCLYVSDLSEIIPLFIIYQRQNINK
jgi:hypothetical protein